MRFRYEGHFPRAIAIDGRSTNGAIHRKRIIFIYSLGESNALAVSESWASCLCVEAQLEEIISHSDNSNEPPGNYPRSTFSKTRGMNQSDLR